ENKELKKEQETLKLDIMERDQKIKELGDEIIDELYKDKIAEA
ncbi:2325_t:CDS:1, partial [Gigaspora rosea]